MSAEQLNLTFAALADPTRRAILARLAGGETSVTELAKPFKMSYKTLDRGVKLVEHIDALVKTGDDEERSRGCPAGTASRSRPRRAARRAQAAGSTSCPVHAGRSTLRGQDRRMPDR